MPLVLLAGRHRPAAAPGLPAHDCTTVTTPAEQAAATAGLTSAAAGPGKAAEALHGLIELGAPGNTGRPGSGRTLAGPGGRLAMGEALIIEAGRNGAAQS